jgi:hypothetical protein
MVYSATVQAIKRMLSNKNFHNNHSRDKIANAVNQDVFEPDGLPLKEGQLFLPGKGGTMGQWSFSTGVQTVGKRIECGRRKASGRFING